MIRRACPAHTTGAPSHLALLSLTADPIGALVRDAVGARAVVERELGGGGMSRLFVGRRGAERVVIKVLVRAAASPLAVRRFRGEAALGRRARHAHLLPVIAAGETDHLLFLVLPFADGGTLRQRVRRTGPLAVAETVRVLRPLADALAHLHALGTTHGDVKPENVLFRDGRPVLADFGAARPIARDGDGAVSLAPALPVVGTPLYMAPEQADGSAPADPRADLYALGVLGWELLAGRSPYDAESPADVLRAHRTHPVPCIRLRRPDVPPALARLLERALAKDPADRPASAREMCDALDRIARALRLHSIPAPARPVARRIVATLGRRALAAGMLAPLLASLAAAAISAATFGSALGTVHRAIVAAPARPHADWAPMPRVVPVERVARVASVERLAFVARGTRTVHLAHMLPTVRTTAKPTRMHRMPLPSVFASIAPPALVPLRVPVNGAAPFPRVAASRANEPRITGPHWVEDRCARPT